MFLKLFKLVAILIVGVLSSCGGEPVVTSIKLDPLNSEQASRVDPSIINLDVDNLTLVHKIVIVIDENSQEDPTHSLLVGENTFNFDSKMNIPMTIEETSTDGNAYVDVYQDFAGGALKKYVFRVPAGETEKYLRLYEIGS